MSDLDNNIGQTGLRQALQGVKVVSIALNLPGPAAVQRLVELGASAIKIEPPGGDPMQTYAGDYHRELHDGVEIRSLNLKQAADFATFSSLLDRAQLLVTAQRPQALERLALDWPRVHARWPRLSHLSIVGHAAPRQNDAGHDLTYMAEAGLLRPPALPPTLIADLAGAERAVTAAFGLLRMAEKAGAGQFTEVALEDAAHALAGPLRHGLTAPGGMIGGGFAGYNLYQTQEGWIALAALEPHFLERVLQGLEIGHADHAAFAAAFKRQTTAHWLAWAAHHDIPLTSAG